jgi:ATP-dependent DNA ligase
LIVTSSVAGPPPRHGAGGPVLPWPQQVMLARPVKALPGPGEFPGGCLFEPKWDGFRGVLHVRTGVAGEPVCRVQSRRGSDLSGAFTDIAAAAAAQLPAGTVVDGELVIWTADRLDFAALQRRMTSPSRAARLASGQPATFLVFDVLAYNGNDWRKSHCASGAAC